jgi:hypothetical protein
VHVLIRFLPWQLLQASEQEHYWNNVDGDGQSLSDCASNASGIFDDDFEGIDPEPAPEKKKRPPRKKKKKQTVPMETTNEENEKSEPVDRDEKAHILPERAKETIFEEVGKSNTQSAAGETDTQQPVTSTTNKTTTPQKAVQTSLSTSTDAPTAAKSATIPSLNLNAKAWNVASIKPAPQSSIAHNHQPIAPQESKPTAPAVRATVQTTVIPAKPIVVQETYKPKPGSWASMAVKKSTSTPLTQSAPKPIAVMAQPALSRISQPIMASPIPQPLSPIKLKASPSPDWRNHVVSPHRRIASPKAAFNMAMIPPAPVSQPTTAQAWPSLGDFPPPSGAKQDAEVPKQTKPKGVWGSK